MANQQQCPDCGGAVVDGAAPFGLVADGVHACRVDNARRVKVALWLAHLYSLEAIDLDYAWPPSDETRAQAAELYDAADRCHAYARELNGGDVTNELWQASVASFESAVSP